jgi:hypothetical protein
MYSKSVKAKAFWACAIGFTSKRDSGIKKLASHQFSKSHSEDWTLSSEERLEVASAQIRVPFCHEGYQGGITSFQVSKFLELAHTFIEFFLLFLFFHDNETFVFFF